ncbi:MAG TPA: flagellar hook capping FlgD N-terminal domain-containing protein [Acidobacteriota bacterium]|nr:flagellar hook capping FlgD N-terminal domain-containing protein [Acidobacteriota bacterium]
MSFISPILTDSSGQPRTTGSQQILGKDDFLQLLVTKLRYQDPLKPVEDEAFIAQLAQFSSLEQMNNIAEGISASNQWDYLQMQSMNNVMAAGFIGNEIRAEFTGVYADQDNEPTISYSTSRYADRIEFKIHDAEGNVVRTLTVDGAAAGTGSVTWDGRDQRGNRVAEGYYTVEASGVTPSGEVFAPSLTLVGVVSTVIYRDGQAFLVVDGTEIALGDVVAVGEPGSLSKDD